MSGMTVAVVGLVCSDQLTVVEGSVCVASAFSIATDKLVGDCDMVPSTSASFTPALEAEIRGARQA